MMVVIMADISPSARYIPREDTIFFGGEQKPGFVIRPSFFAAGKQIAGVRLKPHLLGAIPNPAAFSEGPDLIGSARILKRPHEDLFVPEIFAPFVPFIQMAVDREVSIDPAGYESSYFTLRPSRHQPANGFSHQPEFGDWHAHGSNGRSSYYAASDIAPTLFPDLVVKEGQVVRFEDRDTHRSPVTDLRRTFVIGIFYRDMPDQRGRLGLHRYAPDGGQPERTEEWRLAADQLLAGHYPVERQAESVSRWLLADGIYQAAHADTGSDLETVCYAKLTPLNFPAFAGTLQSRGKEFGVSVEPLFVDRETGIAQHSEYVAIKGLKGKSEPVSTLVAQHAHFIARAKDFPTEPAAASNIYSFLAQVDIPRNVRPAVLAPDRFEVRAIA